MVVLDNTDTVVVMAKLTVYRPHSSILCPQYKYGERIKNVQMPTISSRSAVSGADMAFEIPMHLRRNFISAIHELQDALGLGCAYHGWLTRQFLSSPGHVAETKLNESVRVAMVGTLLHGPRNGRSKHVFATFVRVYLIPRIKK